MEKQTSGLHFVRRATDAQPNTKNAVIVRFIKNAYFIKRDKSGKKLGQGHRSYLYPKPYIFSVSEKDAQKLQYGMLEYVADANGKQVPVMVIKVIHVAKPENRQALIISDKREFAKLAQKPAKRHGQNQRKSFKQHAHSSNHNDFTNSKRHKKIQYNKHGIPINL